MNSILHNKVILVCVNLKQDRDFDELVAEGIGLVESAGYNIAETMIVNRKVVDNKFFIGSGKVEELKVLSDMTEPKTIIINHNLTSVQERNLEAALKMTVIDRTRLILDIFASRVRGNEGILQVELAVQTHQLSRLVRRWSHLERQRGGIGVRGGPGETQIEMDKRMIAKRIESLKGRLTEAVKQRHTQRKSRLKQNVFSISIVGYTNAGKSTLFNALTKSKVYVADRLFATLQTTSRKLFIEGEDDVVLSDTVGFIRDLPHTLVAAFRATLEETVYANLLIHVVDASQILRDRQIVDVNLVLKDIKADHIPQLIVYNKIDLKDMEARIDYAENGSPVAVYVSASQNKGLDLLTQAIIEKKQWIMEQTKPEDSVYEPWKH